MLFPNLTESERSIALQLLEKWKLRARHQNLIPGSQEYRSLLGACASVARHGMPPNYRQRAVYRSHKRRRARKLAAAIYGDPLAPNPRPNSAQSAPSSPRKKRKTSTRSNSTE